MDKLQWFKFSYADWRMGKIQRCPEVTQARFINLCCLYWSKECLLSYEDAEIEIDKEHLDILIKKKIVSNLHDSINISFLDEQFAEIEDKKKDRSVSGVIGNLKRWKPDIYNLYQAKEITLEEAISMSKNVAEVSLPDSNPIATQSQMFAEKSREEEKREEKRREEEKRKSDFDLFWNLYDKKTGKEKVFKKFSKLKQKEIDEILNHVPKYVLSTPDKKYRKDPSTYLNGKHWEDEIEEVKKVIPKYHI